MESGWIIYQPLIVGFGAVVLALIGNTLLEWVKQRWTNDHAAETLRRALVEELRQARNSGAVNLERKAEPQPGGSFLIPVPEKYPIYEANISNLGLLRPAEVSAVVRAYGMLQAQIETYAAIGTFHKPQDNPILHAIVDSKWGEVLEENGRQLQEYLDRAIETLSTAR
jgi:hypothetical protein